MIVELGDINDNPPSFLKDKYFIGVSQDAGVSTTIITMEVCQSYALLCFCLFFFPINLLYFITKLAIPLTLHIYPPAKRFIPPFAFVMTSVHHTHLTRVHIVCSAARHTC